MKTKIQKPYRTDVSFIHPFPPEARRIAWDAISFCVPRNWELSVYEFMRRNVTRIELEDEYSIRLEAEWIRNHKKLDLTSIMQRYTKASKPLTLKSDDHTDVNGLPPGWKATHFVFKETEPDEDSPKIRGVRHDLVTAFYICPQSSIFCFLMLHFLPDDKEQPADIIRMIATTFQNHATESRIPWQMFDLSFSMPQGFKLTQTQFDIGSKLMLFKWRQRRFFLWHFSCADVFLEDGKKTPAAWSCAHLNGTRMLKAPVFKPDGETGIVWRRRMPFILGHREEIASACYRYDAGCILNKQTNTLIVWVYHHRRPEDIGTLFG